MKILYIHGLDSKLSHEKKAILEKFGPVLAPDLDYYSDSKAIESIFSMYKNEEIDVVIGSSMGGFTAYYVSTRLEKPALLFNPALKKRSVEQAVPSNVIASLTLKQFVIGAQDDVVNPGETLNFLSEEYNEFTDFHLHIRPQLSHGIPLHVFEQEVESFFAQLN